MRMLRILPVLAMLGLVLAACESIWDIREAKVDPALLSQDSDSGSDESGGAAGNAAFLGEAGDSADAGAGGESGSSATTNGGQGGSAGQTSNAGNAGAGGAAERTLCEQYCDAVMTNCKGDYAVYTDQVVCLAVCAALPVGEPGAQTGNSVHCRLRAAKAATIEVPFYCPIAGPGGNGTCGTDCEGLCRTFQTVCTGENAAYADEQACLTECKGLKNLGTFTVALSANQYKGNHVQCRLYHVSASSTNPDEHCSHASGQPPCNPESM